VPDDQNDSLRAGLRISQISFGWTLGAGTAAIAIGVIGNSLALIIFGLIGLLDGIGSASLIVHFRHSLRHLEVSDRHERRSLLIITGGLAVIGMATAADSAYRLHTHATSDPLILGIALAALSTVVLVTLALRKRKIAREIPSHALHSDGWVSGVGAVLAIVVLAGGVLTSALGLWWIDPVAAICIACGAVILAVSLLRASP
jgi:divalent metal cation (Fe/Co/Zn/Cd) transporter